MLGVRRFGCPRTTTLKEFEPTVAYSTLSPTTPCHVTAARVIPAISLHHIMLLHCSRPTTKPNRKICINSCENASCQAEKPHDLCQFCMASDSEPKPPIKVEQQLLHTNRDRSHTEGKYMLAQLRLSLSGGPACLGESGDSLLEAESLQGFCSQTCGLMISWQEFLNGPAENA